ncbi:translation initiation factor IF-3 protein [Toxoplasma gondii GT1]|uniref:Translation initiation factor IF-3 protein n=7 Tax=Toxoplasma gondii TaxID=5811 RepID=A0A125YN76_TOXGV|nr:translation initiation factor IF-3 protein [Toxoplasma gondii GT1]ESS32327.1 translation initiation factor IF-3 protein [Toxoplasma gondii VEG]KAF4640478.1 translation initiation factor IF-3 protein [Toxoplasma gondii]KFG33143.1 translation initiation factor IF-3 protein [Toxoplasma gondii FOU]PUA91366.1 translation initiation factor IF-3 protein [Toxoplasma gondii TgCATBr9]RQX74724.1 translation initiation factor IF-3 protein [Toxoplasma gondii CAST]
MGMQTASSMWPLIFHPSSVSPPTGRLLGRQGRDSVRCLGTLTRQDVQTGTPVRACGTEKGRGAAAEEGARGDCRRCIGRLTFFGFRLLLIRLCLIVVHNAPAGARGTALDGGKSHVTFAAQLNLRDPPFAWFPFEERRWEHLQDLRAERGGRHRTWNDWGNRKFSTSSQEGRVSLRGFYSLLKMCGLSQLIRSGNNEGIFRSEGLADTAQGPSEVHSTLHLGQKERGIQGCFSTPFLHRNSLSFLSPSSARLSLNPCKGDPRSSSATRSSSRWYTAFLPVPADSLHPKTQLRTFLGARWERRKYASVACGFRSEKRPDTFLGSCFVLKQVAVQYGSAIRPFTERSKRAQVLGAEKWSEESKPAEWIRGKETFQESDRGGTPLHDVDQDDTLIRRDAEAEHVQDEEIDATEDEKRAYRWMKAKREQKGKKQLRKEIRVTPRIADHDLQVKANRARQFILEKNQVTFTVQLRGRERSNPELYRPLLERIAGMVDDIAAPANAIKQQTNALSQLFQPRKKKCSSKLTSPPAGANPCSATEDLRESVEVSSEG